MPEALFNNPLFNQDLFNDPGPAGALLVSVSDSLSISENVKLEIISFIRVSDSITITELVKLEVIDQGVVIHENIAISDRVSILIPVVYPAVSDRVNISEKVTVAVIYNIIAGSFDLRLGWQQGLYNVETDWEMGDYGVQTVWQQSEYNIQP